MDIATMTAINNLNTVNMLNMMAGLRENENIITFMNDGKEYEDMSGSMLDQYVGKECVVSLFNEVGAVKGTFMDADEKHSVLYHTIVPIEDHEPLEKVPRTIL